MESTPHRREQQVFNITTASSSQSDEIARRQKRYAFSMAFRTLCFVLAVALWSHILWLAVVFITGALLLPYTSVILANAGVRQKGSGTNTFAAPTYGELNPGKPDAGDV